MTSEAPFILEDMRFDLLQAYRYCKVLTKAHYENFPVAIFTFSDEQKKALYAIYAFLRTLDDFADEPFFKPLGGRLLDQWEKGVDQTPQHPIFVALEDTIKRFAIPKEYFHHLISAFRQDLSEPNYQDFDDLIDYCKRSANPVGRLVLHILGIAREPFVYWSDCICTALQLTNFWQDISVDLSRGRVYLPQKELKDKGLSILQIRKMENEDRIRCLLDNLITKTFRFYKEGLPLVFFAPFPYSIYFGLVVLGGVSVLAMVKNMGIEVIRYRPSLSISNLPCNIQGLVRGLMR